MKNYIYRATSKILKELIYSESNNMFVEKFKLREEDKKSKTLERKKINKCLRSELSSLGACPNVIILVQKFSYNP